MQLPLKLSADLMQTRWKSIIDPLLENPLNNIQIIEDVVLKAGENKVRHNLLQKPNGWVVLNLKAAAIVYSSQDFTTDTLTLVCVPQVVLLSGNTTVNQPYVTNISDENMVYIQKTQLITDVLGVALPTDTLITAIGTNQITLSKNATATVTDNPFQIRPTEVPITLGVF